MTEVFLYRTMFFDLLRLKRILVWGLIVLAIFGISALYVSLSASGKPSDDYVSLSSLLVFRLLPLASAIFSASVVSQEIEQKTIVYLLTRPVDRGKLILSRWLASVSAVAVITIVCAVLVSGAAYGANALSNPYLLKDCLSIVMGAAAYGALFVFLSLLMNRAMIASLIFAFAWETAIPNMPGSMSTLSISSYLSAIAERPESSLSSSGALATFANNLGGSTLSASTAWVVLIVMIGVLVAASMFWFKTNEYIPREDAE